MIDLISTIVLFVGGAILGRMCWSRGYRAGWSAAHIARNQQEREHYMEMQRESIRNAARQMAKDLQK